MSFKRGGLVAKRYVELCFSRSLLIQESEKRKIWHVASRWCFDVIIKQHKDNIKATNLYEKLAVDVIAKWLKVYNPLVENVDPIQNCFEGALVEYFQELFDSFAIHAMRNIVSCEPITRSILYKLEDSEETKYMVLLRYYVKLQLEKDVLSRIKTTIGSIGVFPVSFCSGVEYNSIQHYVSQRIERIQTVFGFQPPPSTMDYHRLFDQLVFETGTPERFLWEEENKEKLDALEKTIDTIVSILNNKKKAFGEHRIVKSVFNSEYICN